MKTKEYKSDDLMYVAKAIAVLLMLFWMFAMIMWARPVNAGEFSYGTSNTSLIHGTHDAHYQIELDYFEYGLGTTSHVFQNGVSDIKGQMNFQSVTVPNGATIMNATLYVKTSVQGTDLTPRSMTVYGVLGDITLDNMTSVSDMSSSYTELTTRHDISAFESGWEEIDVTNIIQEVVDQTIHNGTGDIGLIFLSVKANSKRSCSAYDGGNIPYLTINYRTEAIPSGTTFVEEYKDYEIYTSTSAPSDMWMIRDLVTNNFTIVQPNTSLNGDMDEDNSLVKLGSSTGYYTSDNYGSAMGDMWNNTVYLTVHDASKTEIRVIKSPYTDMVNWTDVGQIAVDNYQGHDVMIDQSTGVLYYVQASPAGIHITNVTLQNDTIGALQQIWVGGAATTATGVSMDIDSSGGIHVAGSVRSAGSSNRLVRYCYRASAGSGWVNQTITGSSTQTYYPRLHIAEDHVFIFYTDYYGTALDNVEYVYFTPVGNQTPSARQDFMDTNADTQWDTLHHYTDYDANGDALVVIGQNADDTNEIMYNIVSFDGSGNPTSTAVDTSDPWANYTSTTYMVMGVRVDDDGGNQFAWYVTAHPDDHVIHAQAQASVRQVSWFGAQRPVTDWDTMADMQMGADTLGYFHIRNSLAGSTIWIYVDPDGVPHNTNCTTLECVKALIDQDFVTETYGVNVFDNFLLIIGIMGVIIMGGSIFMGISALQNGDIGTAMFYFAGGVSIGYGLFIAWLGG